MVRWSPGSIVLIFAGKNNQTIPRKAAEFTHRWALSYDTACDFRASGVSLHNSLLVEPNVNWRTWTREDSLFNVFNHWRMYLQNFFLRRNRKAQGSRRQRRCLKKGCWIATNGVSSCNGLSWNFRKYNKKNAPAWSQVDFEKSTIQVLTQLERVAKKSRRSAITNFMHYIFICSLLYQFPNFRLRLFEIKLYVSIPLLASGRVSEWDFLCLDAWKVGLRQQLYKVNVCNFINLSSAWICFYPKITL